MPVVAAAFCPHPPLLVPALAAAAAPELDALRAACSQAVGAVAAYGLPVLVLGPGPSAQPYPGEASGSLAAWGVDVRAGGDSDPTLPLSLTIGAWLLDRAGVAPERRSYRAVGGDGPTARLERPVADLTLLVMADGSAARTARAPRAFEPAAEVYDTCVAAALASGVPEQLAAGATAPTASAVAAGGAAAWAAAATLFGERPALEASLLSHEAPYGVGYLVALWTWGA